MMNTEQNQTDYYTVVQLLADQLAIDPVLSDAITFSLVRAVEEARGGLDEALFLAYDFEFNGNGWPTNPNRYLDYLNMYVRLVPNEERYADLPSAWTSDGTKNGYNQKVYDLLCQFYWLIDQPVVIDGKETIIQHYVSPVNGFKFAEWLMAFAEAWGLFLNTPESLTTETLMSFKYNPMYNYELYAKNEASWGCFNEFFFRQFNDSDPETGITPLRPIAAPADNKTITAPADCTFHQIFPINEQGEVIDTDGKPTTKRLKHTHSIGTIEQLLNGSPYAKDFNGGTFVHYFLGPFDYHRFHTPVHGEVVEIRPVRGQVFLNVNLESTGQWDAPDNANDGYEFNQARGIIIIDTKSEVGKVAVLPIGMAQVSGVHMYENLLNQQVVKGQEFGKFSFGGSDIIMLFEKAPEDMYFWKKDPGHVAYHFQYGQTAIYWDK